MPASKRVRIIKKIRESSGIWKFISLARINKRYVWDKRPGYYFVEWWQGRHRKRQLAGQTPTEAGEAQRRKRNELLGELIARGKVWPAISAKKNELIDQWKRVVAPGATSS